MPTEVSIKRLFAAVAHGDRKAAASLVEHDRELVAVTHADAYWTSGEGTPLQLAAEHGNVDIMRDLLDLGADVNAKGTLTGWSPLHLAIKNPDAVRLLLERGAQVDLHAAAGLGDLQSVRRMVEEEGQPVDLRGPDGATALHFASTPEMAALLLDLGVKIDSRDDDHHLSPLGWSADNKPVARLLLDRGAPVDNVFLAAAVGATEKVREFLDADPSLVNARTGEGDYYGPQATPLHLAAGNGHDDVVTLLLERGADSNAVGGWFGVTPLHWAVQHNATSVARILLAHHADANIGDREGNRTPLDWARHFGRASMIELLSSPS